jgi:lambda family phage holin
MAIAVSVLRVVYDRNETSFFRIALESLICGALTVTAGSALVALGYSQEWYLFCGGTIGFMGSQSVRILAYKLLNGRIK